MMQDAVPRTKRTIGGLFSKNRVIPWRGVGITAGILVAARLAFGGRKERQTQLVGLNDTGMAPNLRHRLTDFGSGYLGHKAAAESGGILAFDETLMTLNPEAQSVFAFIDPQLLTPLRLTTWAASRTKITKSSAKRLLKSADERTLKEFGIRHQKKYGLFGEIIYPHLEEDIGNFLDKTKFLNKQEIFKSWNKVKAVNIWSRATGLKPIGFVENPDYMSTYKESILHEEIHVAHEANWGHPFFKKAEKEAGTLEDAVKAAWSRDFTKLSPMYERELTEELEYTKRKLNPPDPKTREMYEIWKDESQKIVDNLTPTKEQLAELAENNKWNVRYCTDKLNDPTRDLTMTKFYEEALEKSKKIVEDPMWGWELHREENKSRLESLIKMLDPTKDIELQGKIESLEKQIAGLRTKDPVVMESMIAEHSADVAAQYRAQIENLNEHNLSAMSEFVSKSEPVAHRFSDPSIRFLEKAEAEGVYTRNVAGETYKTLIATGHWKSIQERMQRESIKIESGIAKGPRNVENIARMIMKSGEGAAVGKAGIAEAPAIVRMGARIIKNAL